MQVTGKDGRVLYRKSRSVGSNDFSRIFQDVSDKETKECCACVQGGCALEACTSRIWRVGDGIPEHPLLVDPGLKMVTGAEAERAVSCPCVCAARKS
jgi:hypothetical protein